MKDLSIELDHHPGALAHMGEVLGLAAKLALQSAGIVVHAMTDVLVQRLDQAVPGQLGKIARRMADASVNIEVMYRDHEHRLILVVDDYEKGRAVSDAWERERAAATLAATGRHTGWGQA